MDVTEVQAYGTVQLDMDAEDYIGCVDKTNNTAELSAVPHALRRVYRWSQQNKRSLNLRSRVWTYVIMVYDSEYTRMECDAAETDPLPQKNRTTIRMIRRLLAELKVYHICVHWVKVRGHSNQHGNDKADKSATWGQNGGRKNAENMTECMEWLKASTQVKEEDENKKGNETPARHNDGSATMNTE